jgi:hypothetical protein
VRGDIGEIRDSVRSLSAAPGEVLATRVRSSVDLARGAHTQELFAQTFARFIDDHLR